MTTKHSRFIHTKVGGPAIFSAHSRQKVGGPPGQIVSAAYGISHSMLIVLTCPWPLGRTLPCTEMI